MKYLHIIPINFRHLENVAELYFMQMATGNMMEYSAWRKKLPTPEFLSFSNAYRLEKLAIDKKIGIPAHLIVSDNTQHQQQRLQPLSCQQKSDNESSNGIVKTIKKTQADVASPVLIAGKSIVTETTTTTIPLLTPSLTTTIVSEATTKSIPTLSTTIPVKTAAQITVLANSTGSNVLIDEKKPEHHKVHPPTQQPQAANIPLTQKQGHSQKLEAVSKIFNIAIII